MGWESDYESDGLNPSERYFKKQKKGSDKDTYYPLKKNQNHHITRSKEKFKILNTKCREIKFCTISL